MNRKVLIGSFLIGFSAFLVVLSRPKLGFVDNLNGKNVGRLSPSMATANFEPPTQPPILRPASALEMATSIDGVKVSKALTDEQKASFRLSEFKRIKLKIVDEVVRENQLDADVAFSMRTSMLHKIRKMGPISERKLKDFIRAQEKDDLKSSLNALIKYQKIKQTPFVMFHKEAWTFETVEPSKYRDYVEALLKVEIPSDSKINDFFYLRGRAEVDVTNIPLESYFEICRRHGIVLSGSDGNYFSTADGRSDPDNYISWGQGHLRMNLHIGTGIRKDHPELFRATKFD